MPKYQNILVAVDGSEEAKLALEKATAMANQDNAQLMIAHIIDTRAFAMIDQYDRTVVSRAEEYGKELLENYKKEAQEAGVEKISTILDFGSPKIKIPKDIPKEFSVDLIVSGATGLNAVERALVGSVSESIVRQASCDVLVVRN